MSASAFVLDYTCMSDSYKGCLFTAFVELGCETLGLILSPALVWLLPFLIHMEKLWAGFRPWVILK